MTEMVEISLAKLEMEHMESIEASLANQTFHQDEMKKSLKSMEGFLERIAKALEHM